MATNRTNLAARPTHPRTTQPPSDGGPTTKDADPNATAAGGSDEVTGKHPLGDQSGSENETYRRGRFRTKGNSAFFEKSKIKNNLPATTNRCCAPSGNTG